LVRRINRGTADNRTVVFMKNMILTHKEIQINLFLAMAYGLEERDWGYNLHLIHEVTDDEFRLRIVEHPTKESSAIAGKPVFYGNIPRWQSQMNDVRISVTVYHLREKFQQFIADFNNYMAAQSPNLPKTN
jgi:hypothetical protein